MARDEDTLWTQGFRARYLKNKTFFEYKLQGGTSSVWKGIIEARHVIRSSSCFKLGNGHDSHPLFDPWVPELEDRIPRLKEGIGALELRRVVELKNPNRDEWNFEKLEDLFEDQSVRAILNLPWPTSPSKDILIWKGNKIGSFSVKNSFINNFTITDAQNSFF